MTTATTRLGATTAIALAAALLVSLLPAMTPGAAASAHATGACPPGEVPASGFEDATGPHGAAVDCLVAYGITEGRTATSYGTQATIRRDQLTTMAHRLLRLVDGFDLPPAQPGAFGDVPADSGHAPAIDALAGLEPAVVQGYEDGTFRPRAEITRGQIASILVRASDHVADQHPDVDPLPSGDHRGFDDVAGSPHASAIGRLAGAGLIRGYGDGSFGTGDAATRGQIATIMTGLLDQLVAAGAVEVPATISGPTPEPDPTGVIVGGSVEQVYLVGADPHTSATLYDPDGEPVANGQLPWSVAGTSFTPGGDTTDAAGSLVFRGTLDPEQLEFSGIEPGAGYTVEYVEDGQTRVSEPVTVLAPDEHPEQSFYDDQVLEPGLTYITTRDGTQLSVYVTLPGPAEEGPYPTLVEYSGYDVSQPPAPLEMGGGSLDLELSLGAPTMAIGQLLDYATVAVNIRGTGCSGGAFDYFETLQALDGYDAIETVAAQDWSANVGTTGVSYPGIAQLFLASTQPPSLAAAAPMAIISDHARDTVMPGGIYNTGFAQEWAQEREIDTRFPGGQSWVDEMVGSDHPAAEQCEQNVRLRGQNLPLLDRIEANEHASDLWDTRTPWSFAQDITTNLFIIHSWQDEQTGGRSAAMLDALDLDRDDRTVRFVGTNGTHVETLGPEPLTDLIEFLELYVAERTPEFANRDEYLGGQIPGALFDLVVVMLYQEVLGDTSVTADDITIPDDRFEGMAYEQALAAYEAEAPARILFETGAGAGADGFPFPAYDHRFAWSELPDLAALAGEFDAERATWYLQPDGQLGREEPTAEDGSTSYTYDPDAFPDYSFASRPSNSAIWLLQPAYRWLQPPDGHAAAFVTPELEDDLVLVGSASVDLTLRTDNPERDTDLEVVLTEVRPDGSEMYLTAGWLRASKRHLDEATSTPLRPRPTFREQDVALLDEGEWHDMRVETFPFGHTVRAGSRLRLSVEAPGGNRPIWRFEETVPGGPGVDNDVAHGADGHVSRVVLPMVDPAIDVPVSSDLPACAPSDDDGGFTAVRGQPCRTAPQDVSGD